jgi:hypothetical protein
MLGFHQQETSTQNATHIYNLIPCLFPNSPPEEFINSGHETTANL